VTGSRTIGLIGGSGLDDWSPGKDCEVLTGETPWGAPSDPVRAWRFDGCRVLFLPRHGHDHRHPPHRVNYRANIHRLRDLGARAVLAVNTVGGISPACAPGVLAVPDQLIDYTWGRAHTFSDGPGVPASLEPDDSGLFGAVQHADFESPFSNRWRKALLTAGEALGLSPLDRGCVGVTQGPRLETAAEVERLARDGCDMVNMTLQPEASLAREAGLAYACLAVVANRAAGRADTPITLEAIENTVREAMGRVRMLLSKLFEEMPEP
jgi:5'-methylthioinosine phosphorylase